jgi:hypothetical protein
VIRTFISVLSAGGDLQRDRFNDRRICLRQRLMRNYLSLEVGQSLTIPSLFGRLEPPSAVRLAICGSSPLQAGLPLLDRAALAELTTSITSRAQQKLNATSRAIDDPKGLRRHQLQNRRLLDMELRPC